MVVGFEFKIGQRDALYRKTKCLRGLSRGYHDDNNESDHNDYVSDSHDDDDKNHKGWLRHNLCLKPQTA